VDFFVCVTMDIIDQMAFTPIVLIGLLITSLSFILNLKSTNSYIQKFQKHPNMDRFLNLIVYTSVTLLVMLIIGILSKYFLYKILQIILSIIYLALLGYIMYSLFIIVFILKEIVRTSLKN